jgi:hypothetical protein
MIVRDARGSLVHVRRRDDGECVGCIELGLYEIVRQLILAEKDGVAVTAVGEPGGRQPSAPCADHIALGYGRVGNLT